MSFYHVQQEIVSQLQQEFDGVLKTVEPHRGQFDSLSEIRKLASRSPTLLVSYRGFKNPVEMESGYLTAEVPWLLYLLAEDRSKLKRDKACGTIAESVCQYLQRQTWGLDAAIPEGIISRNITNGEIDKAGLCLWSIAWQQNMTVQTSATTAIEKLREIFGEHEQAQAPKARDLTTITQD